MMQSDEQVLKTDRLGRVHTPVARREQLLEEFERSGLSGIKYAALVGVKYPTFAAWLKRRRRAAGASVAAKPVDSMRWLEAVVDQAQSTGSSSSQALVLELPGGARAQIGDIHQAIVAAAVTGRIKTSHLWVVQNQPV